MPGDLGVTSRNLADSSVLPSRVADHALLKRFTGLRARIPPGGCTTRSRRWIG